MAGSKVTNSAAPVRFCEPGGHWRAIAYGPLLCLAVFVLELILGGAIHWFALALCAVLLAGFAGIQVVAARRHASVSLTDTAVRCGTETLALSEVAEVLDPDADNLAPTRVLGELSGVPRRRTGVALRLRDGARVQAWARDDTTLRRELTAALQARDSA